MPELQTQHLLFLPFSLAMKKMVLHNKVELEKHIGVRIPDDWPGPDFSDALPFFIKLMEQDPSGSVWDGIIIHSADQVVIGDMGFKGGPDELDAVEIGYSIVPTYRRRGYATEMASALITWAFQQPDILTVVAECLFDNIGSIKVLEKLGMRRVGAHDDLIKWEVRREEWRAH